MMISNISFNIDTTHKQGGDSFVGLYPFLHSFS